MEKYENAQNKVTTDDVIAQELADEKNNSGFVEEYLKINFMSSAVDTLFHARRQAVLTQTQVAERLKTKQAAIARLEADTNGSLTLRHYAEFALACGMVPLNITLAPIDLVRQYILARPNGQVTQEEFNDWSKSINNQQITFTFKVTPHTVPSEAVQSMPNVSFSATTLKGVGPTINVGLGQPQTFQYTGGAAFAAPPVPQKQILTLNDLTKFEEAA